MTMVQLQNADRLTQIIVFGTVEQAFDSDGYAVTDENGLPHESFKAIGTPILCGRWNLSTSQVMQEVGLNQAQSFIVIVHHRRDWEGITHALLHKKLYEVTYINQDPFQNPTAYDQITLSKVGERNDGFS